MPIITKVEVPLGKDTNGSEAKRYWTNPYASVIVMIFYLASKIIPDISFSVYQCAQFTHNTKASHEKSMKGICLYFQGTMENGLAFNPSNNLLVDCYANADFAGLWVYENPQDPISDRTGTVFMVTFSNCLLLWVSKIQT